MRRPKLDVQRERNAEAVAALCATAPRPKRRPASGHQRWVAEAERMRQEGDWSQAASVHLVALYVQLHEWCYGVKATEVQGEIWLAARSAADRMVREEFGASVERAVEFLRWCWRREHEREQWRRQNDKPGSRITWRQQFQRRSLVTDYRLELERRHGTTKKV